MSKVIVCEVAYEFGKAYTNLMKVYKIFNELDVSADQYEKLNQVMEYCNKRVKELK